MEDVEIEKSLKNMPMLELRNRQGHIWRFYRDASVEGFEDEDIVSTTNYMAPLFNLVIGKMVKHGVDPELVDYFYRILITDGSSANVSTES